MSLAGSFSFPELRCSRYRSPAVSDLLPFGHTEQVLTGFRIPVARDIVHGGLTAVFADSSMITSLPRCNITW